MPSKAMAWVVSSTDRNCQVIKTVKLTWLEVGIQKARGLTFIPPPTTPSHFNHDSLITMLKTTTTQIRLYRSISYWPQGRQSFCLSWLDKQWQGCLQPVTRQSFSSGHWRSPSSSPTSRKRHQNGAYMNSLTETVMVPYTILLAELVYTY